MPKKEKTPETPLSRGEALWVVDWMESEMGVPAIKRGFYAILRLTPSEVSKKYNVPLAGVLKACRRPIPQPA